MWMQNVIFAAVLGLAAGVANDTQGLGGWRFYRWLVFGWAVAVVASDAATVRGFFVVFLSAVGAYKVARMIGEDVGAAYRAWRANESAAP